MSLTLVTIPLSPFCEKARWGLEFVGLTFKEQPWLPGLHYAATLRHRSLLVPILRRSGGRALRDSTDILKFANQHAPQDRLLYPSDAQERETVERMEDIFDDQLGIMTRRWCYHRLLKHDPTLLTRYSISGLPIWQRLAAPRVLPLISRFGHLRLTLDDDAVEAGLELVGHIFDRVAEQLFRSGGPFLMGHQFSAADIAFAALAAPLLLPSGFPVVLPKPAELPEIMQEELSFWRSHVAAQYALRLYRDIR